MPSTGTPELEHARRARRTGRRDRLRPPDRMMPLRIERADRPSPASQAQFAIHADLAHAARDQLGVLRAEIEDQDAVGVDVGA
jgi:hypothetical protein